MIWVRREPAEGRRALMRLTPDGDQRPLDGFVGSQQRLTMPT